MNRPRNARQFLRWPPRRRSRSTSAYADDRDIAMFSAGRLPLRAPGWIPACPRTAAAASSGAASSRPPPPAGDQPEERRARELEQQARARVPGGGRPVGLRLDLPRRHARGGHRKRRKHTLASVVSRDERGGDERLPRRRSLARGGTACCARAAEAPSDRARRRCTAARTLARRGASRLDRELDGKIDDPGAAIIDAAWPKITDAVLTPVLGPQLDDRPASGAGDSSAHHPVHRRAHLVRPQGPADAARPQGPRASTPTATAAAAEVAPCKAALWAAIEAAGDELAAAQGPRSGSLARRTRTPSASTSTPACSPPRCASRTGRAASSRCSGSRATGAADEHPRMQRTARLDHPEVREIVPSHHCLVRFRERRPFRELGTEAVMDA